MKAWIVVSVMSCIVACAPSEPLSTQSKPTAPTAMMGAEMVEASEVKSWTAGEYLVVDVRGQTSYELAVIPGAIPVYFERLGPMYPGLAEHPKSKPVLVVAENDQDALRGAQMLVAGGYIAKGVIGGVVSWEQAGLPLEKKSTK